MLSQIPKGANVKRSIYYDPVWNPYGAPPPGMPYKERCTWATHAAPTPDPYAVSDTPQAKRAAPAASADDSDDDIALPTAPRPPSDDDDDSDDDIVMPAGPPPPEARVAPPMPIVQPRIAAPRAQPETVAPVRYDAPSTARKHSPPAPEDDAPDDAPPADTTTISAAPQLRAFQHDATTFVPTSVRKRARQR